MKRYLELAVGWILALKSDPRQAQRGLSQSTEVAILLAAALTVAAAIVVAVKAFVSKKLAGF